MNRKEIHNATHRKKNIKTKKEKITNTPLFDENGREAYKIHTNKLKQINRRF